MASAKETDPSAAQAIEEIGAYYRAAKSGDPACIRTTYGGTLSFETATVVREAVKSRIVLDQSAWNGGASWYVNEKSCGKNCRAPGGQARLVIPTTEIEVWSKEHPLGISTHELRNREANK